MCPPCGEYLFGCFPDCQHVQLSQQVDQENTDVEEFAPGLVCLTGGDEGPLASALAAGGESAGCAMVERLVRIFGLGNVYVELQRHGLREQEWRNQAALRIASSLRLPVLATNGTRGRNMAALFRDVPEAIANTALLSQRLEFELDDLGYVFPSYPAPDGDTMGSFLRKRVMEGVAKRYRSALKCELMTRARRSGVARDHLSGLDRGYGERCRRLG